MIILPFGLGKNKKVLHAVVTIRIEEGFKRCYIQKSFNFSPHCSEV